MSGIAIASAEECARVSTKLIPSPLQEWLGARQPYDVIVDGANVAFFGQSFEQGQFQFGQIGDVIETVLADMPGSRPLVVSPPR